MPQTVEQKTSDSLLRLIAEGTASVTGDEFFRTLVRYLASALQVRCAFVAEFAGVKTRVRTLAFWSGDCLLDNFEFDLVDTPCEAVLAGEMRLYKKGIQALFPGDKGLAKMGAESYLAIPLVARSGDVMGHLALVDVKPMHADQREMSIFNVFAARARAELERKRAEERLANVLASAMDAIITIDGERRIMLFNSAAERVFGCAAGWAMGQPFDRFLSKRFRSLVEGYLRAADMPGGKPQQMWAPEGLTALRANREEFPIEATISPFESAGQRYYTIILRDINDRRRTEAQLNRLQWERAYLQDEVKSAHNFEDIVGQAPVMKRLFASIEQVAPSDSTVLLMGETGTGKELIAHAIHNVSLRKDKLLVKLNCAALPSELIVK
jgi:PAS domain S-box-containing protein